MCMQVLQPEDIFLAGTFATLIFLDLHGPNGSGIVKKTSRFLFTLEGIVVSVS